MDYLKYCESIHVIISLFRWWISDILVSEVDHCWVISGREMNAVEKTSQNITAVECIVDRIMTTQIECFDKEKLDIFLLWT